MDKITLGQVWEVIAWVAGAIGVLGVIVGFVIKARKFLKNRRHEEISEVVKSAIASEITPMTDKMSDLENAIKANRLNSCKDFLVRFLADVEQNQPIDEIERERFCEVYAEYRSLGGNSYIHGKVEKLKKEGKL